MINCLIDDLQKCNRVAIHLEFRELTFDKKVMEKVMVFQEKLPKSGKN